MNEPQSEQNSKVFDFLKRRVETPPEIIGDYSKKEIRERVERTNNIRAALNSISLKIAILDVLVMESSQSKDKDLNSQANKYKKALTEAYLVFIDGADLQAMDISHLGKIDYHPETSHIVLKEKMAVGEEVVEISPSITDRKETITYKTRTTPLSEIKMRAEALKNEVMNF